MWKEVKKVNKDFKLFVLVGKSSIVKLINLYLPFDALMCTLYPYNKIDI